MNLATKDFQKCGNRAQNVAVLATLAEYGMFALLSNKIFYKNDSQVEVIKYQEFSTM